MYCRSTVFITLTVQKIAIPVKKRLDFECKEDRVSLSDFSMVDFAASSSTNRSPTIPSKSVKSRHVVTKIREKFVTKADLETSPVAGPSGAIHGSTDTSNGLKKSTSRWGN